MEILKIYNKKLRYKRYAPNSISSYSFYVKLFLEEENIADPYQITTANIITYLENKTYTSASQQKQIIGALKLFSKYILNKKDIHLSKIEYPRQEHKIPLVIHGDILKTKILSIKNIKHKGILSLAYSCCLRVSEVINLKITDVDGENMLVRIKQSKGSKDRNIKLSKPLLAILRAYFLAYKPQIFLFNGQFSKGEEVTPYSKESCNQLVKRYIGNQYRFHTLRHSGATQLFRNGTPETVIQKILGHKNIETTLIYLHNISTEFMANSEMPI